MNSNPRQIPLIRDTQVSEQMKKLSHNYKQIKEKNSVNEVNVSGLAVQEHVLYLNPLNGHNATNSSSSIRGGTSTGVETYTYQSEKRSENLSNATRDLSTSQVNFSEMDTIFFQLNTQMKNQNPSRFCEAYTKERENLLSFLRFSPLKSNAEVKEMSRLMINYNTISSQVPSRSILNSSSFSNADTCPKTFTTQPHIVNRIMDKTHSMPLSHRKDLLTSTLQKISSNSEALICKEDHNKFTEKKRQPSVQLAYENAKRGKAMSSSSTSWPTKEFSLTQSPKSDTKHSPKKVSTQGSNEVSSVSIPLYLKDVCGKAMQSNPSPSFKKPSPNVHFNISMTNINIAPNNLIINERDNKLIESIKQLLLKTNNKFTEEYTKKEKVLRFFFESSEKKSASYEITHDHLTGQILRYQRVSNGKEISMDYSEDSEAFIMHQLNDVKGDLERKVEDYL